MQLDNLDKMSESWKSEPSFLVSLLDMLKFWPIDFCIFMRELEAFANDSTLFDLSRDGLDEAEFNRLVEIVNEASKWCELFKLNTPLKLIKQINDEISPYKDMQAQHLWLCYLPFLEYGKILEMLHKIIREDLPAHLFMFIPKDDAKWYKKEENPADEVSRVFHLTIDSFRSAIKDINEAGNCYATGCYTACVFHLMRVAEIGLRELARDRRVTFERSKNAPMELREFKELFAGLAKAVKDIDSYPKTKAREDQFEFYHGAMIQLEGFIKLYRHRTMHARKFYDKYTAKETIESVSRFMEILATKISETKRTPLVWKKSLS